MKAARVLLRVANWLPRRATACSDEPLREERVASLYVKQGVLRYRRAPAQPSSEGEDR